MEGCNKSYRVQYPDIMCTYITEHWHDAYRLQVCPEWILGGGEGVQDCLPSVWADSFVYTSVPYSYFLCVARHEKDRKQCIRELELDRKRH